MFIINSYQFGVAYDADAQAFFTAAGITDATQKSAVNQLVLDLKSAGIWTKFYAIYPFVGGAASPHSYNLKDPTTYQISFIGSPTHSSTGVLGNGTSTAINTNLIPSVALTTNSHNMAFYSGTNKAGANEAEFGGYDAGTNTNRFELYIKYSDGKNYYADNGSEVTGNTFARTDGLYAMDRNGTAIGMYVNGSANGATTQSIGVALTSRKLFFINNNNQTTADTASAFGSLKECRFASIASSLTATENTNFYTAVQAFETTLGRQV